MHRLGLPVLVLFLLQVNNVFASGGTAMDAFNFVTGARSAGMGGAQTASVSDATAIQYNPAALVRVRGFTTELSSLFWVFDIQYHYLAVAAPMLGGSYGASVQYLNYGPIESTEGLAPAVNASDLGGSFGGGYSLNREWSVGGTFKYFSHQYSKVQAMEMAADIGATYVPVADKLAFGMVVQNVGYSGESSGTVPPLPMSVRGGLAYAFRASDPIYLEFMSDKAYIMRFLLALDVSVYQTNEPATFNVGGETVFSDILCLRAGYLSAIRNSGGGLNCGVGVRAFGMRLDYALGMVGELGYGQYVSFTWLPGSGSRPAEPEKAPEASVAARKPAKKAVPKAKVDIEDSVYVPGTSIPLKGKYLDEYGKALEDYNDKEYESAITRLHAILEKNLYSAESWQLLGNCRYAIGSKPGAIKAYRRALKINPNNPQLEAFVGELEKP